jgi:uncharacterized protein DUF4239
MVFDAPLWLSGLVLIAGLSGFSLAAQWLIRTRVMQGLRMRPHEAEYPATIIASVMVFYGLVAALVAITVWEKHTTVEERVSAEASSIASVWRDLGGYPEPARDSLHAKLRDYTEYVIEQAWPEYRKGRIPAEGVERLNGLQDELLVFEPATESQKILHAETLRAYNQMVLTRRLRLDAVGKGLPGVIWLLVIAGGMISLVVSLFFPVEHARYQSILIVSLATLVALVILVILALDQPFRGDLGIGPESLRLVHDHLMVH